MVTDDRRTERSITTLLFDEGYTFEFHQAIRLLEQMYPHRQPVGETCEPGNEVVRFRSTVGLSFPASSIDHITAPLNEHSPARMAVNFMGLAGVGGPLPLPITELILERLDRRDTTLRDFLDMFNHRLISLLYRVRKIHRVGMDIRSPERSDIAGYLRSIIGLGTAFLQGRMGVPDRSLLLYAGILSHHPRSMAGLERILGDYFQVRASGGQLRGTWRSLDESQQTVIGLGGKNNRLGQDTVLGKRFWDQSGSFTMELGPMGYNQFCEMLPGREGCHALHAITRLYTGDEYDCEITLLLRREEAPVLQLGSNNAARLGWTSWLASDGRAEGEALRVRLPNQ